MHGTERGRGNIYNARVLIRVHYDLRKLYILKSRKVWSDTSDPNGLIGAVWVRCDGQFVGRIEGTSAPDCESSKCREVGLNECKLFIDSSLAGSGVASTGLTKESLSVSVVLEEGDQVGEYLDVVGAAFSVSSTVVEVKVFVDVEDYLGLIANRICHSEQRRACFSREGFGARPAGSGNENELGCGTSCTNGINGSLYRCNPCWD